MATSQTMWINNSCVSRFQDNFHDLLRVSHREKREREMFHSIIEWRCESCGRNQAPTRQIHLDLLRMNEQCCTNASSGLPNLLMTPYRGRFEVNEPPGDVFDKHDTMSMCPLYCSSIFFSPHPPSLMAAVGSEQMQSGPSTIGSFSILPSLRPSFARAWS